MTDKVARKVVQVSFLVLFLYPFLVLIYKKLTTLGMPTLVSWLLPFDPLLYLGWALRNGGLTLAITLPLLLVVLTLFGGRFFCGWVCPLGTLFDLVSGAAVWRKMPRGKLHEPGSVVKALTLPSGNSYLKYWLMAAALALAVGSLQLVGFLDPLVVFNRLVTVAMSDGFFTDRMETHGLEVLVPDAAHHDYLNSAIYDELVHGHVLDRTRHRVVEIIDELWDAGAEGVLLGCTELELLIHQADCDIPVFPCTTLHVEAALDRALGVAD